MVVVKSVAEKIGFDIHTCWQLRFSDELTRAGEVGWEL